MVRLEYFSNGEWIDCGEFHSERIAWISLGSDNLNYRTVDKETGEVLKDNRTQE